MDKDELKKLIENYLYRIVNANDQYRLYCYLHERKADRLEELNMAPAFFSTVFDSLKQCFVIEIFKLYDINSDTGLIKLFNICMNCSKLFPNKRYNEFHQTDLKTGKTVDTLRDEIKIDVMQDINKLRKELIDKESIVNNLRGQRDKFYAHLDKKYFMNKRDLSKDFPVSFDDVELLLDFAGEMCNTLLLDLCGEAIFYQSSNYDDVKNILDQLHKLKNT